MDPTVLLRLVDTAEFQIGFIAGIVALAMALLVPRLRMDWGLLWLSAVIAGAIWATVLHTSDLGRALLAYWWVTPAGAVTLAALTYALNSHGDHPEMAPAFAISVGGVWATVPDTEQMNVVLGVTAALLWLWWPRKLATPGMIGVLAVGLVAIAGSTMGAVGRPGAYVGAFGSLASLALMLHPRQPNGRPWVRWVSHVGLVFCWSRLAGLNRSPLTALAVGGLATVLIMGAKWLIQSKMEPRQGRQAV